MCNGYNFMYQLNCHLNMIIQIIVLCLTCRVFPGHTVLNQCDCELGEILTAHTVSLGYRANLYAKAFIGCERFR